MNWHRDGKLFIFGFLDIANVCLFFFQIESGDDDDSLVTSETRKPNGISIVDQVKFDSILMKIVYFQL